MRTPRSPLGRTSAQVANSVRSPQLQWLQKEMHLSPIRGCFSPPTPDSSPVPPPPPTPGSTLAKIAHAVEELVEAQLAHPLDQIPLAEAQAANHAAEASPPAPADEPRAEARAANAAEGSPPITRPSVAAIRATLEGKLQTAAHAATKAIRLPRRTLPEPPVNVPAEPPVATPADSAVAPVLTPPIAEESLAQPAEMVQAAEMIITSTSHTDMVEKVDQAAEANASAAAPTEKDHEKEQAAEQPSAEEDEEVDEKERVAAEVGRACPTLSLSSAIVLAPEQMSLHRARHREDDELSEASSFTSVGNNCDPKAMEVSTQVGQCLRPILQARLSDVVAASEAGGQAAYLAQVCQPEGEVQEDKAAQAPQASETTSGEAEEALQQPPIPPPRRCRNASVLQKPDDEVAPLSDAEVQRLWRSHTEHPAPDASVEATVQPAPDAALQQDASGGVASAAAEACANAAASADAALSSSSSSSNSSSSGSSHFGGVEATRGGKATRGGEGMLSPSTDQLVDSIDEAARAAAASLAGRVRPRKHRATNRSIRKATRFQRLPPPAQQAASSPSTPGRASAISWQVAAGMHRLSSGLTSPLRASPFRPSPLGVGRRQTPLRQQPRTPLLRTPPLASSSWLFASAWTPGAATPSSELHTVRIGSATTPAARGAQTTPGDRSARPPPAEIEVLGLRLEVSELRTRLRELECLAMSRAPPSSSSNGRPHRSAMQRIKQSCPVRIKRLYKSCVPWWA